MLQLFRNVIFWGPVQPEATAEKNAV